MVSVSPARRGRVCCRHRTASGPPGRPRNRIDRSTGCRRDITDPAFSEALVDATRRRYGRIDILVNNAGSNDGEPLEDQSLEERTSVIDINLVALMYVCRLAAPLLFAAERAAVVNVASMYGIVGSRCPMAAYKATQGAVVNLTRTLAAQWGSRGYG